MFKTLLGPKMIKLFSYLLKKLGDYLAIFMRLQSEGLSMTVTDVCVTFLYFENIRAQTPFVKALTV